MITFCPGLRVDQLQFGNGSSIGPEELLTYFDVYDLSNYADTQALYFISTIFVSDETSEEEISNWWNRINYAYEDIFMGVSLGHNTKLLSKSELVSKNSNITLVEINTSFGRCFSFEIIPLLPTNNLLKFQLNLTQMDVLWFYVHDKHEKLGFYFNIWFQ